MRKNRNKVDLKAVGSKLNIHFELIAQVKAGHRGVVELEHK